MTIGLHSPDLSKYPNLALMKLSAFHKKRNDNVSFYSPLFRYDKIYSSKVFTFSKNDEYLPNYAKKGGTGYKLFNKLPDEIEHICPDYKLFNLDYSVGFTTRGCNNNCFFCIVNKKEGMIKKHAAIEEFLRHKKLVLMDNNILACNFGIKQLEKISKLSISLDINQGIDATLIDKSMAKLLGNIKWIKYIRLACDDLSKIKYVLNATKLLKKNNIKYIFCYVLGVNFETSLYIINELKKIGVDPFLQPYRDFENKITVDGKLKKLSRWCNNRLIFNSTEWNNYKYRDRS